MLERIRNEFKKPYDNNELKMSIIYGLIYALVFSVICAMVDLLIQRVLFSNSYYSFVIAIFMIPPLIYKKMRIYYSNYHIIYATLLIFLSLIGVYIYNVSLLFLDLSLILKKVYFLDFSQLLSIYKSTLSPSHFIINLFSYEASYQLSNIIRKILYALSIYGVYKRMRNHY